MKSRSATIALASIAVSSTTLAQTAGSPVSLEPIVVTTTDEFRVAPQPDSHCLLLTDSRQLNRGSIVVVLKRHSCTARYSSPTEMLEIAVAGKRMYTLANWLELTAADSARLATLSSDQEQEYEKRAYDFALELRKKAIKKALAEIDATRKFGLAVVTASIADVSQYTEGTSFRIEVFNPTKKPIKYVSLSVVGLNSVNDPVRERGGTETKTVKGIGPIEPGASATYEWKYMWHTDIVQSFRLSSIKVDYMDGTTLVVRNVGAIRLSSESVRTLRGSLSD